MYFSISWSRDAFEKIHKLLRAVCAPLMLRGEKVNQDRGTSQVLVFWDLSSYTHKSVWQTPLPFLCAVSVLPSPGRRKVLNQ
jgi:hypothetical protein